MKEEQASYIAQLESTCTQEKAHNELLTKEVEALTTESSMLLDEKSILQTEILTASEYIISLEDKCWKANKTSLDLL